MFISARREAKTTKAAALELTSTATESLRDMADATEDLGVLAPAAKDTHEHLIESLRAVADGYAAAQDRIESLPDTGFGAAFAAVLAAQIGSKENDVEDLFEDLSSRSEYARALDQDRVCAGVRYMQGN
ncbi:hypothetical protein UK23_12210 [Lentzea aerocolonigenes]|uniref:Uncharacterized protein n=1 Tax=Lentzea aerocolonigenes TaxID=68170 RepID=A0A0F0H2Q0_LENAE|nr:hypothetical protein UK23_12210 [Lentzea aerocolonigenes]